MELPEDTRTDPRDDLAHEVPEHDVAIARPAQASFAQPMRRLVSSMRVQRFLAVLCFVVWRPNDPPAGPGAFRKDKVGRLFRHTRQIHPTAPVADFLTADLTRFGRRSAGAERVDLSKAVKGFQPRGVHRGAGTEREGTAAGAMPSEGSYYDEFNLCRSEALRQKLNQAEILIENWRSLIPHKEAHRSVVKKGSQSDEAFTRQVLGKPAAHKDIIIINDEAHLAYPRDSPRPVTCGSFHRPLRRDRVA